MPKFHKDLIPYQYSYISGSAVACGTTSTVLAVPTGANAAVIHAEGGAIYWSVGAASVAGTTAPGYCAQDQSGCIPDCDNIGTGIPFIGSGTAAVAHVEFYSSLPS